MRDWEGSILGLGSDEVYSKDYLPSKDKVKEMIRRSMDKVGITGERLKIWNSSLLKNFVIKIYLKNRSMDKIPR